ncbi:hypothetical protein [Roseateles terrae]|uniref:Uncharacterized protein n=1 Tax=Roseateles terrae TaxID=431060 RepID=A0ABR6GTM6_9BURK|nr:hypothetical protein [Roseateles terrae]MBB3195057.1 hypothetical protein [Roseateles terrae]OWQ87092.1 hypothetical protein CDN98_09525 [Roseateles terrae]
MTPQHESLLWELADRFFADRHVRYEATPQVQIDTIRSILSDFDAIEAQHLPDQIYTHKRLNLLDAALEILFTSPEAVDQASTWALAFAADGLPRIPKRFAKSTPFGAACTQLWIRAHEAIYRFHPQREPRWDEAFQQFEAAVQRVHQSPRTHSEGSLISAKPHVELFKLGQSMPWMTVVDLHSSR